MKLAIMQPYFLPYIGYFQLIAAVDQFVIYDNIEYTKKGWINRNRMLQNNKDVLFSLALKKASDHLHIQQREIAEDFNYQKLLNQIKGSYRRAPYFDQTFPLIEEIITHKDPNLFHFLKHSIIKICKHLDLKTEIKTSSEIDIDHTLTSENKVLALCNELKAETYINAIGGVNLYSKEAFRRNHIDLKFIKPKPFHYPQFGSEFMPWLSIMDVMMFNPIKTIQTNISTNYELI